MRLSIFNKQRCCLNELSSHNKNFVFNRSEKSYKKYKIIFFMRLFLKKKKNLPK